MSEETAYQASKFLGINNDKIKCIYNPIIQESLYNLMNEEIGCEDFIDNKNTKIVLGVGRLVEVKGFDTLIKAFEIIKRDRNDVNLVILGEGDQREKLENLIRELKLEDCVFIPGFFKNPYKFMKICNVFVLSSRREGFGNVLVEAMACGAKIVSTNCKSGPIEILDNGKYGKIVDVDNIEEMSLAIQNSLSGDRNNRNNRSNYDNRIYLSKFNIKEISKQYIDIIYK